MNKIVLVCQKRDDRTDNLIKCLKYLFPECSVELRSTDKKSFSTEIISPIYEPYLKLKKTSGTNLIKF